MLLRNCNNSIPLLNLDQVELKLPLDESDTERVCVIQLEKSLALRKQTIEFYFYSIELYKHITHLSAVCR